MDDDGPRAAREARQGSWHFAALKPLLLAALLCLVPFSASADEPNEICVACHEVPGFDASVHAGFDCTSCHTHLPQGPHEEIPPQPVALATCGTCHTDVVEAYGSGVHGKAKSNGATEAASCNDCHGAIHDAVSHGDPESPMHWSKQAATCARCHADVELIEKFNLPVARPVEAYLQSAHARAVAAGKHGAVCGDCHGAHGILPLGEPESPLARTKVADTCGECHREIAAAYRSSVHGDALKHGVREVPSCTDCHGEHKILGPGEPTSPVFTANIPGETCGRCHADERLSEKYGLRNGKVSAFQDSYHGLALRTGTLKVANCASCHGVHDIRPSKDPLSQIHPSNLASTCGKCHPGAGVSFQLGSVHGEPGSANTVVVDWVRFAYLWLIALTVGFMGTHNLLDIVNKALRPASHHSPAIEIGAEPERMNRGLRWEHGLVMISFPVLVYTGFALTYPEAWWASPLLHWETRLGLRGVIHRAAGVTLLVASTWHVVHVIASRRLRSCMGAMVPRPYDGFALLGTLAYYFGLRETRPLSGAFSYIEKAEYWAFLWGTVVMVVTGFVLWFENTTLHYLPSWVPDAATAVHFYEAILATLSILVWHFYWVIFDPDVYPMDWTWWHGQSPASRIAERVEEEPDASSESWKSIQNKLIR